MPDLCNKLNGATGVGLHKKVCFLGGRFVGSETFFSDSSQVDMNLLKNVVQLRNAEQLPGPVELKMSMEFTKQRSDQWFAVRNTCPVSGSTLHKAVGLGTLKETQEHFDTKIRKIEPKPPTPQQEMHMRPGTENEDSAFATLATQVLPLYFPGNVY